MSRSPPALPGEVTTGLPQIKSAPGEIDIGAYAIFRDAGVLVAEGTHVEMPGGVLRGDLRTHPRSPGAPAQPPPAPLPFGQIGAACW